MSVILGGLTALTEYGKGASIPFANGIRIVSGDGLNSNDVPAFHGDKLGFSFWNSMRFTMGGLLKTSNDVPSNYLNLDRIVARELTKGVMAANINDYDTLPMWVKEGVPAVVHGSDDILTNARRYLLTEPLHLWITLNDLASQIDTSVIQYPVKDYPAYAGYMALRYMINQTLETGIVTPDPHEEFIVKGLHSSWLAGVTSLLKNSFGLEFDEDDASVHDITVNLVNTGNDGTPAYVQHYDNPSNGKAAFMTLNINMYYMRNMDMTNPNGVYGFQGNTMYLDRVVAHEMTHGLMAANIDYFSYLPAYIKEGLAELVHGVDDVRGDDILILAGDESLMQQALVPNPKGTSVIVSGVFAPSYAAGYILLRFMANNVQGRTPGDVIKRFVKYLDNAQTQSASDIPDVLDEAVNYASDGTWSTMALLHSDILSNIYMINYSQTPQDFLSQKCNVILTNDDTGAITGFDADYNNPTKNAEDIVPETSNVNAWTLPSDKITDINGLKVHWPVSYVTSMAQSVTLNYQSATEIMGAFMEVLDINGASALDTAINTATTGIFTDADDLMVRLTTAVIAENMLYGHEEDMKNFLNDACGIYLDNLDTGSITGLDAGGNVYKTEDGIIPEYNEIADWNLPQTGSSLINNLNVNWNTNPILDMGTSINSTARDFILRGLNTEWINNSLDLINESLGIQFGESNAGGRGTTSVNTMSIQFVNDITSPNRNEQAYIDIDYSGSFARALTLKINMRFYNAIDILNPNGSIGGSSQFTMNTSLGCVGDGFVSGNPFSTNKPANSLDFYSWTNIVRQNFSEISVYNFGVAGEDSIDTFNRFIPDVTPSNVEYCLIMTGLEEAFKTYTVNSGSAATNPIPYTAYAQSIIENIHLTIDMARSYNMSPIVSYAVLPDKMIEQAITSLKGSATNDDVENTKFVMNIVYDGLVELVGTYTYHNIEFIDFGVVFTDPYTGTVHDELFNSGFPNIAGYERMGDLFVRKLVVIYFDYYTKKENWRYVFDLQRNTFTVYDTNNSIVKQVRGVQELRDLQIDFTILRSKNFEVLYNGLEGLFYVPADKLWDIFDGISGDFYGIHNNQLPDSELEEYHFRLIQMAGNIYVGFYDAEVLDDAGRFVRFRQGMTPAVIDIEDVVDDNTKIICGELKYDDSMVAVIDGWYSKFEDFSNTNQFYVYTGEHLKGEKLNEEFESNMFGNLFFLLAHISKTMYPYINPVMRFGEIFNNRPVYEPWLIWNVFNQLFQRYNRIYVPDWDNPNGPDPYSEDLESYTIPTLDLSPNMSY